MPGASCAASRPWVLMTTTVRGVRYLRVSPPTLGLCGVAGPFEAVEDQIEPELELVGVVVAGLENVVHG